MTYRVLVLPRCEAMTPGLLQKIKELGRGRGDDHRPAAQPQPESGRLSQCDEEVKRLAAEIWGTSAEAAANARQGNDHSTRKRMRDSILRYAVTDREFCRKWSFGPTSERATPLRYTHRRDGDNDIYFVANCRNEPQLASLPIPRSGRMFRRTGGIP